MIRELIIKNNKNTDKEYKFKKKDVRVKEQTPEEQKEEQLKVQTLSSLFKTKKESFDKQVNRLIEKSAALEDKTEFNTLIESIKRTRNAEHAVRLFKEARELVRSVKVVKENSEKTGIEKYRDELYDYLFDLKISTDGINAYKGNLEVYISWGDWKHEHAYFKMEARKFFKERNIDVEIFSETTEQDGSDTYSAKHTIVLADDDILESSKSTDKVKFKYAVVEFIETSTKKTPSEKILIQAKQSNRKFTDLDKLGNLTFDADTEKAEMKEPGYSKCYIDFIGEYKGKEYTHHGYRLDIGDGLKRENHLFNSDINEIEYLLNRERTSHNELNNDAESKTETTEPSFDYQMLGRLVMDCEYFLNHGYGHEPHLWANTVENQIAEMRKIYNRISEKPSWLTKEQIDEYETKMLAVKAQSPEEKAAKAAKIRSFEESTKIIESFEDEHIGKDSVVYNIYLQDKKDTTGIDFSVFDKEKYSKAIDDAVNELKNIAKKYEDKGFDIELIVKGVK